MENQTLPEFQLLDSARANLLAQAERVPADKRDTRIIPDRWSVAEIVEHLAIIESNVGRLFAMKSAEPLTATKDELAAAQLGDDRIAIVRDRSRLIEAPARVIPTGTVTYDAAIEKLHAARNMFKQVYQSTSAAILDGSIHPHPVLGPLVLRHWLNLAAHHEARHADQIAELADQLS